MHFIVGSLNNTFMIIAKQKAYFATFKIGHLLIRQIMEDIERRLLPGNIFVPPLKSLWNHFKKLRRVGSASAYRNSVWDSPTIYGLRSGVFDRNFQFPIASVEVADGKTLGGSSLDKSYLG